MDREISFDRRVFGYMQSFAGGVVVNHTEHGGEGEGRVKFA